jgi:hypothetical protein
LVGNEFDWVKLCIDLNPITSFGGIFDPDGFFFDVSWEVVFLLFDDNDTLIDISW